MAKTNIETSSISVEETSKSGKKTFSTYSIYIEEISSILFKDKYRVFSKKGNEIISEKKDIKTLKEARDVFAKFRTAILNKIK